jgi:hypothetical protein
MGSVLEMQAGSANIRILSRLIRSFRKAASPDAGTILPRLLPLPV